MLNCPFSRQFRGLDFLSWRGELTGHDYKNVLGRENYLLSMTYGHFTACWRLKFATDFKVLWNIARRVDTRRTYWLKGLPRSCTNCHDFELCLWRLYQTCESFLVLTSVSQVIFANWTQNWVMRTAGTYHTQKPVPLWYWCVDVVLARKQCCWPYQSVPIFSPCASDFPYWISSPKNQKRGGKRRSVWCAEIEPTLVLEEFILA